VLRAARAWRLIQDESMLFASESIYSDENTVPGRFYSYAVQSVDLDGNCFFNVCND
jgi:hypothetical protein